MAMSDQAAVTSLRWNNYITVANFTVMQYDYLLLLEKEVQYVWKRPWSVMTSLYLIVRYLGLSLALMVGVWGGIVYMPESPCYDLIVFIYWGYSTYFCFAEVVLIWRLYALYHQSRRVLYILLGLFLPIVVLLIVTDIYLYSRPSAFSVTEIVTQHAKYCTFSFKLGPMIPIYTSIPIICYDIFLVVLAALLLVRHLADRKRNRARPNVDIIMIVRYHIFYFILNLTNQILMTILWTNIPGPLFQLSTLFNATMPFIIAPRLIISIWDTHANTGCVYVSKAFADCVCWTTPSTFDTDSDEQFPMTEYMNRTRGDSGSYSS